ncbi:hypothetical protein [Streptomyces rugosispiralis]|uniref:Uncharacterized protein n=1 Tax=Streptomyces rugosispiralis TaxID=2967341 RepID=A0ABT1V624_9ACTN|nr:hypothetical protein [Streptomyces rugosispiralis]MCQ8192836.1 hypothetical protein [Streptomyces rugosispiralis]
MTRVRAAIRRVGVPPAIGPPVCMRGGDGRLADPRGPGAERHQGSAPDSGRAARMRAGVRAGELIVVAVGSWAAGVQGRSPWSREGAGRGRPRREARRGDSLARTRT